jgi:eukaryotic-like serine/threonine-protein kinase
MTQTQCNSRGSAKRARRAAARIEGREAECVPVAAPARRMGGWNLAELAGEGSWARVYRARPAGTPCDGPGAYALKTLRPEWEGDPQAAALLAREALAGRSLSHPHLIAVLEAHVSRAPRFLVMPWLEGSTLEARLVGGTGFEVPAALWIVRQVTEALEALDTAGWMHGDVKPGNVFLSAEGHVTLLDLGFARRQDESNSITDRWLMGTYNYLAPEYLTTTLRPDIRSDLYSVGMLLYELLSGRPPFHGQETVDVARRHKQAAPPSLRTAAPHVPASVAQLVHRLLAKDPLRRPQSPQELVDRLVQLEIATFSERAA